MPNKPSAGILFERSLKLGVLNILRNKVLSLATIFVIATIIFIFNIILAVNFIAQDALNNLNKKIDVTIYLKESTNYEQAQSLSQEISNLKGISEISYTSKEDALDKIKKTNPNLSLVFEKYSDIDNPLPASLNVTTVHPKYHQEIADFLMEDKYQIYLSNVITNSNEENNSIISSVSKNLLELTNFTHQLIFWLIMTFVLGGVLIILNALQLTIFTRKKEISVMKLVGASRWFIRSPFIIESIIYGILSVAISFLMLYLLAQNISIQETSLWNYYTGIDFSLIFLIELGATILLSIFSSIVAIHEYLRKDLL